jgi:HSP20 family protein
MPVQQVNEEVFMQPAVWNSFREMEDFFNRFQRGVNRPYAAPAESGRQFWAPAVDISETPKEYLVKAEIPGIKKEEVRITVDNGVLMLSGERKSEKESKDEKLHRVERFYGAFERSFSLPDDVVADRIAADYKDGVICVHLPKAEAKKAQTVEVKVQ